MVNFAPVNHQIKYVKMNRLFSSIIALISVLILSASPTTPTTPEKSKDTPIFLWVKRDNLRPRTPAQNPTPNIVGNYVNGILYLNIEEECNWELSITTTFNETCFTISSEELITGIYIGVMSNFTIKLTNDLGQSYIGEVNL